MTKRVNPDMVRLAREARGLTQAEVSEKTGIHQGTISRLELGLVDISPERLRALAEFLHFPESFFFQDEEYSTMGMSGIFYRKKASTLIKDMRTIEADLNIRRIHAKTLLRDMTLSLPNKFIPIDVENLEGDAEAVAQMTRANWRVPQGPIKNLVALIESAGGIIFRFPFGTREIDALSQCPDDCPPLFFLNSESDADRTRFSLAHELGHVIMHRNLTDTSEDEANRFAAEFLMPAKDIQHELFGMSLERASAMKPFWRVSMAALIKRAADLGCITGNRYASLFSYVSRLGFRRKEPNPITPEEPRIVQKLIEAHESQLNFSPSDFSRLLHIHEDEFLRQYGEPPPGLRLAL